MMQGRLAIILLSAASLAFTSGCGKTKPSGEFVARVGDQVLTQEDVTEQLARLPFTGDSLEARDQIIEQWVTNELLYRESRRRGLRNDQDVQRLLAENERSVMVSALISRMYDEGEPDFDEAELGAYYERNKDRLRLREPFVRVRYLAASSREDAEAVRTQLQRAPADEDHEALWRSLVNDYSADENTSLALASTFTAESRLFSGQPVLRDQLDRLRDGQVSSVHEIGGLFHLVQLVERAPVGTIPDMAWIEEELTRRLLIQTRKQLYARQVQRLRNEALAREDLEIR